MIVSMKKQFVFVHIYKTAGTSIKRAIRRYAMPTWQEGANVLLKRVGIPQYGPSMQGDHRTIGDLIEDIDRKAFDRLFSFAFVRNPWDWECSHYRYICQQESHKDHREVTSLAGFKDYIRWRCDGRFQLQQDFILHRNEPVIDFVGRFENLESDFRYVCQRIGIRYRLPKLNTTGTQQYRSVYDDDTRERVAQTYSEDIKRFGYSF
jgi:hypothetical protein